jgi:hypothetical protein
MGMGMGMGPMVTVMAMRAYSHGYGHARRARACAHMGTRRLRRGHEHTLVAAITHVGLSPSHVMTDFFWEILAPPAYAASVHRPKGMGRGRPSATLWVAVHADEDRTRAMARIAQAAAHPVLTAQLADAVRLTYFSGHSASEPRKGVRPDSLEHSV